MDNEIGNSDWTFVPKERKQQTDRANSRREAVDPINRIAKNYRAAKTFIQWMAKKVLEPKAPKGIRPQSLFLNLRFQNHQNESTSFATILRF